MRFKFDLAGASQLERLIPVRHNGTQLEKGALLQRGVTDDTDEPFAVVAAATYADAIGVLEEVVKTTETDSAIDGTAVNMAKVILNPSAVWECEYSLASADTVAATSASSGTTINLTSVEGIAGGWIYVAAGTGAGQLLYITADGANTLTAKSAPGTDLDTTSKLVKILPQWHLLAALNAAATKLLSAAAAGGLNVCVLETYIEASDIPKQRLDPTKHHGLTGLDGKNVKFSAEIVLRDHVLNPLS